VSIGACCTKYLISRYPVEEVICGTERGYHDREVEVYDQPLPEASSCVAKHSVKENGEWGQGMGGRRGRRGGDQKRNGEEESECLELFYTQPYLELAKCTEV